ncbi:hypothetical protein [Halarchaeum sp. P4]|uniref:hypothetical protein n=1 Tax=Halarchaeum sp. P4 TaxID=3421639 RepID=UPI003EBA3C77
MDPLVRVLAALLAVCGAAGAVVPVRANRLFSVGVLREHWEDPSTALVVSARVLWALVAVIAGDAALTGTVP